MRADEGDKRKEMVSPTWSEEAGWRGTPKSEQRAGLRSRLSAESFPSDEEGKEVDQGMTCATSFASSRLRESSALRGCCSSGRVGQRGEEAADVGNAQSRQLANSLPCPSPDPLRGRL